MSMFAIEKAERDELLKAGERDDSGIRNRKTKVEKDGLLKMSSGSILTNSIINPLTAGI